MASAAGTRLRHGVLRRNSGTFAVLAIALVGLAAPASASLERRDHPVTAGPAVAWPLDIRAATVRQQGTSFVLAVRTSGGFSAASISGASGRSLCFDLFRATAGAAVRRVCLALVSGKSRIVMESLTSGGVVTSSKTLLRAKVSRPAATRMSVTVPAADLGLSLGRFRWQAASSWVDGTGCTDPGCADVSPARPAAARYAVPIPTGCTMARHTPVTNASRGRRIVAISFDDGPSRFTRRILTLLRRNNAHATFFQVGSVMGGMGSVQKQILAQGSMIGDHSWSHPVLSGAGSFAASEVGRTKSRIQRQAGFTPCLFRAPYGAISGALVSLVKARGMTTVQWDVDPTDWARPGAGAIASRVLSQTRPGSIILMHDGGGDRSQSVAATGTILSTLKRRGYRVVSVETLLGLKLKYG